MFETWAGSTIMSLNQFKMKKQLLSFLGEQSIKDAKIADLLKHREYDNLIQGHGYWDKKEKKGCAVTCTMFTPDEFETGKVIETGIHQRYETQLGIPRIIARLEDVIFEGLPVAESHEWPINFIQAIPVSVNLENVWRKFMIWLLIDDTEGVVKYAKNEGGRQAIRNVAAAYERSLATEVTFEEWDKLRVAARSYADAADAAAADAADAAYAADAAAAYAAYADAAAAYAAYADAAAAYAADADAYAAYAADAAADAAAAAAADADAARRLAVSSARKAARDNKYVKMSEKLIELLKAA